GHSPRRQPDRPPPRGTPAAMVTAVASDLKRTTAAKLTCKAVICQGLRQPSGGGLADLEVAVFSFPAAVLHLLVVTTPTTASGAPWLRAALLPVSSFIIHPSTFPPVWLWGRIGVALGWL